MVKRSSDIAILSIPVNIVEFAVFVAVFQQLHQKSSGFKYPTKSLIVIYNFMRICRVILRPRAAYLNKPLIISVTKIFIRHSGTHISTGPEEGKTILRCPNSFLQRHMFPYVLGQNGISAVFGKLLCKILPI